MTRNSGHFVNPNASPRGVGRFLRIRQGGLPDGGTGPPLVYFTSIKSFFHLVKKGDSHFPTDRASWAASTAFQSSAK
ncbi:hypothetical protein DESC_60016 [Desulfosarcina cetonica]|nr:hypothetical protein DESC_60016 [Desulfosarcina cetonica]